MRTNDWTRARILLGAVCLAIAPAIARADGMSRTISWDTWKVSGGEDAVGDTDNGFVTSKRIRYPLTSLFDNDPKTAWVYAAHSKPWRGIENAPVRLRLENLRGVTLDAIRLTAGYSKDAATFARNNRLETVEVWIDDRKVSSARLSDRMGSQTISLPRQRRAQRIELRIVSQRIGPDDDLAISEFSLMDRGEPVEMRVPKVVSSVSSECGGEDLLLMRRDGRIALKGQRDEDGTGGIAVSTDRRWLSGWNGGDVHVVDARTGTSRARFSAPVRGDEWSAAVRFVGNDSQLLATFAPSGRQQRFRLPTRNSRVFGGE